jgi:hypothetical protein
MELFLRLKASRLLTRMIHSEMNFDRSVSGELRFTSPSRAGLSVAAHLRSLLRPSSRQSHAKS